jgi:glycosyltransferase involved in cell wall biosynthesis
MACAIPIVSSDADPMPEVVRDAALYFDPREPQSIADTVRRALTDRQATLARARRGLEYSATYTWERCAERTFRFLAETARAA